MFQRDQEPGALYFPGSPGKPLARISRREWERALRVVGTGDCPKCRRKEGREENAPQFRSG